MKTGGWAMTIAVMYIGIGMFGFYNTRTMVSASVDDQYAQVQSILESESDLLSQLKTIVIKYPVYTSGTSLVIIEKRNEAIENLEVLSQTAKQRNSLSMDLGLLDNIIEDLTIIAESYPELKEDSEFGILISELENSESRVVPSIINYNNSATSYNTSLVSIPDRFYASLFGFDSKELIILLSVK